MTGLVEFLRAQLDEDQQQAEELMKFAKDTHLTFQDHKRFLGRDVPGWHTWPDVERMCARLLAEVAAKRAVLDGHTDFEGHGCTTCVVGDWGYPERGGSRPEAWPCWTVLAVAQPYAGRPGWREEWTVPALR